MAEEIRPEPAIRAAKDWLAQVYSDERVTGVSLEEVRHSDSTWEITLSFRREIDLTPMSALSGAVGRAYKVLVVSMTDNKILEMRDRILSAA